MLRIGIFGDFNPDSTYHRATNEALQHAAAALSAPLEVTWLATPALDQQLSTSQGCDVLLARFDGFWCAPGSPYQSMEGALKAIQLVREHDRPFVGT